MSARSKRDRKVDRKAGRSLMVMLTDDEHTEFHRLAEERDLSLRDLIVSAVLGSEPPKLLAMLLAMELRIRKLEREASR